MLNPAFDSGTSRKLPFAVGYVYGQGDPVFTIVASDGSQLTWNILGEGEWDGPALANNFAAAAGTSVPALPAHLVRKYVNDVRGADAWLGDLIGIMHFHSGAYSRKGSVTDGQISQGPDQGYDSWWPDLPLFTPPQSLSGMAYAVWRAPLPHFFPGFFMSFGQMTVSGAAVWRSTRCRIFDTYGNVIAYQFTCNPAWHKVEAILRFKIRPQQPGLAGLTAAEKACFNWPSIVELAARNDYILPNGSPRFIGNHIWAADATLTSILEAMLRDDRSFIREQNGQIYMIGNDSRVSVFQCSANHVVPGSVKLQKKDISKAPNVFVPAYRDVGIPAVSEVVSVIQEGGTFGQPLNFTLTSPNPFLAFGVFTYGGSSAPSLDGDYNVGNYSGSGPTNMAPSWFPTGIFPGGSVTGGFLGSNDARFSQRAPRTVQHRSAQRMTRQQAPGLTVVPSIRPVRYDCGNSTYDQTNRLMKFERDSSLGTDTGAGWTAPITGTLTCYLEAVDANGKPLLAAGVHDVITLDDWVYPEKPGDYEIMEIPEILAPAGDSLGAITLLLRQYNPAAATDVSDPPGDSYQNVPNDGLELTGFAALVNPAWVMQATPEATVALDTTLTITMPDLFVQVMGQPVPTAYPTASWAEITPGTPVLLYVTDASGIGTSPTFTVVAGTTPLASPAAGEMLLFAGTFVMSVGGGSGPAPAVYSPTWPLVI